MTSSNPVRPSRPFATAARRGFTLVELVIVVSILAVAALVAMPTIESTQTDGLDLAANQLANAIRHARGEAQRTARPHGVHLEAAAQRFRVFRDSSGALPPTPVYDVIHPLTKRAYEVDLDEQTRTNGVTFSVGASWSATCNRPDLLGFDATGRPRCGDPWTSLLATGTLSVTHAGHSRTILVEGETGRVTIQ